MRHSCVRDRLHLIQHQFQVNLGSVTVSVNNQGLLTKIEWHWKKKVSDQLSLAPPVVTWLMESFHNYFTNGTPIGEVPWDQIDQSLWTPFQKQVYKATTHIPHGETRTYGWAASRIGNGAAGRAVGQALRCNPLPILVPCHRVVAVTSIGGFMGTIDPNCSELRLKQRLIALEEEYINPLFNFLTPSRDLFAPIPAPAEELLLEALA